MATKANSTTATQDADPNEIIYIHNEKTGGVTQVRRRSLNVWAKKGWAEGAGKDAPKDLPKPTGLTPVAFTDEGQVVNPIEVAAEQQAQAEVAAEVAAAESAASKS